jgi:hypothetical protein
MTKADDQDDEDCPASRLSSNELMGTQADAYRGCAEMRSKPPSQQGFARPAVLAALLLAGAAIITGCAAATVADHMPAAVGGLPEGTPPRPETPAAYPAVNDMPPPRASTVLTGEEQTKIEDELVAARNRAATAGGSTGKPAGSTRDP